MHAFGIEAVAFGVFFQCTGSLSIGSGVVDSALSPPYIDLRACGTADLVHLAFCLPTCAAITGGAVLFKHLGIATGFAPYRILGAGGDEKQTDK